ncbi:General substrate transporter [Cynara cardunculus var. scolymus]|uniref:General substrate transporter n=1 Tax=Cynara cardunculus var. scolymus TaxID=59895 RepID=A0A118JYD2_CYNCS|nr:General substrate transporter [Cynara cardunculus var. scolymus]
MSFRDESEDGRADRDLRKPFLHTGSWYRMGSRQSSMMTSSQMIRDRSVSVLACVLIVALGPIQFGFTGGYSSPTQAAITRDLKLTVSESLMIAAIPNIIGWLCISFANDTSFLYMGRLLEGFGVGIISYTVPVYIAEIAPQNMRGGLGSVNQLSVTVGIMLAYLLGLLVNWRILAILGNTFLFLIAKMGMTDDFESSLQVLRGFDTDITVEVNEIKRSVASSNRRSAIRFSDLKHRRYWFPLMIGIGLLVLQQLSGINGVLFYSSNIFQSAGISSSDAATFGLGAIQVIATGVSTWLVDKTGRRILLIVSSAGMSLSLVVVVVSFFVKGFVEDSSSLYAAMGILSVVGVVGMVIAFSLGMGPIPWLIMSEILPVNIKGLAGSIATLANWFIAWVITMTAPLLLAWSGGGTFTLYMVMCAGTVVFAGMLVPETKGKTLEEIQFSLRQ